MDGPLLLLWGVISRVALPLVAFYRFHGCVLLLDVWRRAYRPPSCGADGRAGTGAAVLVGGRTGAASKGLAEGAAASSSSSLIFLWSRTSEPGPSGPPAERGRTSRGRPLAAASRRLPWEPRRRTRACNWKKTILVTSVTGVCGVWAADWPRHGALGLLLHTGVGPGRRTNALRDRWPERAALLRRSPLQPLCRAHLASMGASSRGETK
ncbi:Uncharacterized protein GBIM_00659 [Gryllus bimaculatus]|nr:Uncharacterized protein GBIM_00659 [Gryllus bimaculatus]